jgi:hypothetical protein
MCVCVCVSVCVFPHRSTEPLQTWWEQSTGHDIRDMVCLYAHTTLGGASMINARLRTFALERFSSNFVGTYFGSPQVAWTTYFLRSPIAPQEQRRRLDWQLPPLCVTLYCIHVHLRANLYDPVVCSAWMFATLTRRSRPSLAYQGDVIMNPRASVDSDRSL